MSFATKLDQSDVRARLQHSPRRRRPPLLYGMQKSRSVLLLEDDPSMALALCVRLVHEGYEVYQASDCAHGLLSPGSRPDVIVLNLDLAGVDGFGLAQVLRRRDALRDVPMVFLSKKRNAGLLARVGTLRPSAIVRVPVVFTALLDAIEESLEGDSV